LTLAEIKAYDCGSLKNPRFPRQQSAPGARIPTLDEVLCLAARGGIQFNIEIKSFPNQPDLAPPPDIFAKLVLEAIRKHRLEKRCIVQSFDFRTLHSMKHLAQEIRLAALWEGDARPFVDIAREASAAIVAPFFKLVMAEQVDAAHAAGLEVIPWTANTAVEWQSLINAGVDAIITDDPAALIAYLKQQGLR
jgi:glycerophosphoryl diester phosphodiesterase